MARIAGVNIPNHQHAEIALTAIYAGNGWVGQLLEPLGIKVAYTPLGIVMALVFIGLPFVVRLVLFLGGLAATLFPDPVVALGWVFPTMLAVALMARLVDRGPGTSPAP